jgi:hypothetical protein
LIGFLAFVLPLTLFVSCPSTLWNFDGVACAAALELGQPSYFFHANHLLYGFFGFLFWRWIGLPIGLTRALPALQLFTSLLSALGLFGVYCLLEPLLKNRLLAALVTWSVAVTAAFWVWSIEAQVYSLGFLALAWATVVLIQGQGPYKYIWVGLLHGAAVLGHLMHFLWIFPALYWMRQEKSAFHKILLPYLGSLTAMTVIPYWIVVQGIIAPGRDRAHVLIWLKGSAGLTPDRSWAWHSSGVIGPWLWLKSTVPALWGSFWPYGKTTITPLGWALTALSMALFSFLIVGGLRTYRSERMARFCGLWLGVYGLFLSTWEPTTLCYRMTDVIPLGILLALGLRTWKTAWQGVLIGLLFAATLPLNWMSRINPMRQTEQNPVYQDMLTLSKITSPQSLYLTGGGLSWIYILYFTGRTAWNAHTFGAARLADEIDRQKQERPVYIQSLLLRDPAVADALKTQKLEQVEQGSPWLQVR